MPDPIAINSMFGRIAGRYDLANRLLSGGMDVWWRQRLVATVRRHPPHEVLDLATGSGDVAFALARGLPGEAVITGMDFCQPMLDEAERKKSAAAGTQYARVSFRPGDGLALPVVDASVDAVTISFGLRNMADRAKSLSEIHRVLRPGGRLYVLEFSQPQAWFRPFYYFYIRHISPKLAGWLTAEKSAYEYLCTSIQQFPDRAGLAEELRAAGFSQVTHFGMTFGIVALHEAVK